jgi:hypothetical protein
MLGGSIIRRLLTFRFPGVRGLDNALDTWAALRWLDQPPALVLVRLIQTELAAAAILDLDITVTETHFGHAQILL